MYNTKELLKVMNFLTEREIEYGLRPLYDGFQLMVPADIDNWAFDVIIHNGSYGHQRGLLEVMGISKIPCDSVEGYLTGEDVIERIKEIYLGE